MADNIITAVFGATRETKVRPRYRYDQGQVLIVRGVKNLPDFYEVHFANEGSTADATPLIGTAEGVEIPGSYFQSGATIYAYIYVHDEATDGTTVYKVTIPIINRARPANVEPTPEQEDIISQAIVALNENVGKAEDAAEQAEASAARAETVADGVEALTARAETAADAAENSATVASSSVTMAQTAAQSASENASAAETAATSAAASERSAKSSKDSAASYVSSAYGYAQEAKSARAQAQTASINANSYKSQAQTASTEAKAAQTAAESAATSAGNAQTAAEAAQTAAETAETNAQTYAGQAQQSATNAGQSAASAAQTLTQVQAEGATQITAIDTEGQRVLDSIPSDYTQMEQDVTDLKSQIGDTDKQIIKRYHYQFTAPANQEHSSTKDMLEISIPAGTEYTVKITASGTTTGNITPREWYDTTNYTGFAGRKLPTAWDTVAQNDVVVLGFYFGASFISANTTFDVEVYVESNVYDTVDVVSGRLDGLSDEVDVLYDEMFETTSLSGYNTVGRRLGRNSGRGYEDANYNGRSFAVTVGEIVKIVSRDRFIFQNGGGIMLQSTANEVRIGDTTYGAGIYFMRVPNGATHVVASYPVSGPLPEVYRAKESFLQTTDNKIAAINDYIRYYKKTFTATASKEHSSKSDQLTVNIPAGTVYTLSISVGSTKAMNVFPSEWYDASRYTNLGAKSSMPNTWTTTAADDVIAIGVYIGASQLSEDMTFTVEVFVNGGISGDIGSLDERVTALETAGDIPAYLQTELDSTVETLRDTCTERSYVICFITDTHYGFNGHGASNWPVTMSAIRAVNATYPIDALVHGGDYSNGDVTKAETVRINEIIRNGITSTIDDCFFLIGNHDDNHFYDSGAEIIDEGERHALYARSMDKRVYDPYGKGYFYYDVPPLGLRIVGLNCIDGTNAAAFTNEQLAWVRDVALDTDYQVAFFCHEALTADFNYGRVQVGNGVELRTIIESFISNGGTVIGYFHGHTHWDYIGKATPTNGFYECSTCCAKEEHSAAPSYMPSGVTWYTRTHETVSQECIDFIVIKPDTRKVKLVRFGVGADREIVY